MQPDTPHRFVQKAVDLAEVGAEFSDSSIDDFFIRQLQASDQAKQYLGDRLANLVGAPDAALQTLDAGDPQLQSVAAAAAIDVVQLLAFLRLLIEIWGRFRKSAG